MPPPLSALCDDLAAEQAALDERLAALDPARWSAPTPAEGWDVRDSVGHLVYFDEAAATALTDPERFAAEADSFRAVPAGTERPDETLGRSLSPTALLERWRRSRGVLLDTFRGADPAQRVPWYGPAMGVASMVTARIMETWAHGQDIADAVGLAPVVSDRLRHVCHLGVAARPYAFSVHGKSDPGTPVRVEAAAPSGGWWTWGPDDAGDHLRGPALDLALVFTQRRHRDDTAVEAEGAGAEAWLAVAQAFAGPAGPGRLPDLGRATPSR